MEHIKFSALFVGNVVCFVWFVVENQTTICHTKGSEEMYF